MEHASKGSQVKRILIGLCAGFTCGYFAVRAIEAAADLRRPQPPIEADPAAYGRLGRERMLAGIARSAALFSWLAFDVVPRVEGTPSRGKRVALVAAGLALDGLLGTPVDYAEDFVVERRYGLSDQSREAWLTDRAKGVAVSIAIAVPLVEALCAIIGRAPRSWPILATAGAVPLLILANLVAPLYIAPLFNTFEPIEGELEARLRALAARYGVGDAEILRVDMSKQTRKANAYVTGLFNTHRIVVGDTLIANFEPNETEFVVAHELGHYVSKDTWRFVALGTAAAGLLFFGSRSLAGDAAPLTSVTGLTRLLFSATLLSLALTPAMAAYSRSRERAADRFALAATNDARGGAAAFARLRDQNLAEDEPPKWVELLFSSHPPIRSRIEALQ
jgi:STE24 endopeptidase